MVNKASNDSLSASALGRLSGVSTDTLRHYERKGVLPKPPRSSNGYRVYPAHAVERVWLIRRALAVGITLDELSSILKVRTRGDAPCREVRNLVSAKLGELEDYLKELLTLRDDLRSILRDWDKRLAATPNGRQSRLLEGLAKANPEVGLSKSRKLPIRTKQRKESK